MTMNKRQTIAGIFGPNWDFDSYIAPSEIVGHVDPSQWAITRTRKKIAYREIPISFDIETTSFYNGDEKCATMYAFSWCIGGVSVLGRTWDDFLTVYRHLVEMFDCTAENRIVVYVHNLAYEFQFIRKLLQWEQVFAISERKPIYAVTTDGVEFRCSYILTNASLATVGKNLQKYRIAKRVGDLDYTKSRHSETPLTRTEIGYCLADTQIVVAYIAEQIDLCGSITKIPLTKTGYVRNACRKNVFYGDKKRGSEYRQFIHDLTLTPDEYRLLKNAFQGGFTHANAWKSGRVCHDVASYDFTSSYPAVMIAEKFPMSRGELVKIDSEKTFRHCLQKYCCVFELYIERLTSDPLSEHILSKSRCSGGENYAIDNGRIISGEKIYTTVTETDYMCMEKFYKMRGVKIGRFYRYQKRYLPTAFVKTILQFYNDKTALKNVAGKEVEYLLAKENVNSLYGMCVTDIVRDKITYSGEWGVEKITDFDSPIADYNSSKNRFLFYPWGVWVTAYARRNLYSGILECGSDYIYSDTDSIKILNAEKHRDYIDRYNASITEKIRTALTYHDIPVDMGAPKTVDGVAKPLGVWDFDGSYDTFKTLGAKRYMYHDKNGYHLTVAGVGKKCAMGYIERTFADPFNAFNENLIIPAGDTGKMTHTYIDTPVDTVLTDYTGVTREIHEKTCVHLENCSYSMSMTMEYANLIAKLGGIYCEN